MMTLWIHSLGVGIGAWLVATVLGAAMAVAVATSPQLRRTGLLAGGLTLALPPFLPANCWLELTAEWRSNLGAERAGIAMLPLTAVVLGLSLWPLTLFFLWGAWRTIQSPLLEAESELRGAAVFRWLLWPVSRGAMETATVFTLTLALANFTVPTLFQVRVFTEEFWLRYNTQFDLLGALSVTWPLWLFPMACGWAWRRRPITWPREFNGTSGELLANRLGIHWCLAARCVSAITVLVTLLLPLGQLTLRQRTWTELASAVSAARMATFNSFCSSSITAMAVVAVGFGLSGRPVMTGRFREVWLLKWGRRGTWLFFLMPGVFLSVVLITLLNRPGFFWLYSSFGIVWLALGLRYLAPVWGGLEAARGTMDGTLVETARLLGARGLDYFRLITWPQLGGPGLFLSYALYLLCLWDVETIVLLQPPGGETLALRIFNLLHYGHAAQVNALCLVTLGLAMVPILAFELIRRVHRSMMARVGWAWTPAWLGMLLIPAGLSGCGNGSTTEELKVPLDSQLFSAAQIIGSRGVAPGQFNKPRSLTCDLNDNLYVADITGRIQKFNPEGVFLRQWQMPQTDLGKAKGMATDPAGNVIVVEPHYQRVNHFNPDGTLVAQWGYRGTNAGAFILPRCIAVNSAGEYYLGEYTTVERVQRFSVGAELTRVPPSGQSSAVPFALLGLWGKPGQDAGEFNRAEGIAVGPNDSVYVADSCNHRIQVFDRTGKFIRTHGRAGSAPGAFSFPYDVRVEAGGRQFVCEFGNSRLSIFDAADRLVETIGHAGRRAGEFANPWAICLDSKGNLYVADSQNHRVQKLHRRPGTLAPGPGSLRTQP